MNDYEYWMERLIKDNGEIDKDALITLIGGMRAFAKTTVDYLEMLSNIVAESEAK